MSKITSKEIVDNFLAGKYVYDTDEYVKIGKELHGKLASMEELRPLLASDVRSCQAVAVFIAAMVGRRACGIFKYIVPLLESPYVEVRDDVCDCFTTCGGEPENLIKLISHLDDLEQRIRVKVIQVVMWLEIEKIFMLDEYLKENGVS